MLIHITINGKRTSTTLDDLLVEFMMVRFGGMAALGLKSCRFQLQKWLQKKVNKAGGSIGEMKPSEWVRATILREIAQPQLVEKLDQRRPGWAGVESLEQ
nr:hypothetical protein [Pseudomonas sp.]